MKGHGSYKHITDNKLDVMKEKLTVKALSIYIQPYEEICKMLLRDTRAARTKGKSCLTIAYVIQYHISDRHSLHVY